MEQSKLISTILARFKIAYPIYFEKLSKEELGGLVSMYQEELANYDFNVVVNATKAIIRKHKYMPSLKEMIDECEEQKHKSTNLVLDFMLKQGYFKTTLEYDKATKFLNGNCAPHWLKEDMEKYLKIMQQNQLKMQEKKLLN